MSDFTQPPSAPPLPVADTLFLVLEANPVIAADLAQSVAECPGGGPALTFRDHASVKAALMAGHGARLALFLPGETAADLAAAAEIAPRIHAAGARLVVMSGTLTPEAAAARGWLLLPLPFTPAMVHAVVARLAQDAAAQPPAP